MRGKYRSLCLLACFALIASASPAQEGHPLVGSWHGNWGFSAAERRDMTLIVDYTADGADITGLLNPGYDQAPLQKMLLTITKPTDWTFKFEVDLKDKTGKVTHYVAEGKLDQIGYDQRTLKGTWTTGTTKGDFTLTRDRDYTR